MDNSYEYYKAGASMLDMIYLSGVVNSLPPEVVKSAVQLLKDLDVASRTPEGAKALNSFKALCKEMGAMNNG